jgi:hypothetical protein
MPDNKTELKEIFKSSIPFQDSHEAEALFFNCCDFRFRKQAQEFLGNKSIDPFVFPGGIMLFVGGKHGHADMQQGTLYWTKAMVKLHHIKEIILTVHKGCGAYAVAPNLAGKTSEEIFDAQIQDVLEIKQLLEKEIPEIKVRPCYMQPEPDNSGVIFSEIA